MWTLGGETIYVHSIKDKASNTIARLQPIGTGTVLHRFGYESPQYTVEATVVSTSTKNTIRAFTTTGSSYELVGDEGSLGNFYVVTVESDRYPHPIQRIRSDLSVTTPVYKLQIEIWPE